MTTAYYNEIVPFCCDWIRNLIKEGLIPDGEVDSRSICDVQPGDLRGFTQCHFFCGIAGWPYALRLAGWPEDRPVWTGSCPCQPFSCAGKRKGEKDERHLWPEFARLIRECRPPVVFGEQVEGAVRLGWLDGIFGDLEAEGYACGASVLGAHSVGAPHIRQRLYWVAHTERRESGLREPSEQERATEQRRDRLAIYGSVGGLAHPHERQWRQERTEDGRGPGRESEGAGGDAEDTGRMDNASSDGAECGQRGQTEPGSNGQDDGVSGATSAGDNGLEHPAFDGRQQGRAEPDGGGVAGGCGDDRLGDPDGSQLAQHPEQPTRQERQATTGAVWSDYLLIPCRDNKVRRISAQSGDVPLAHGIPRDLGRVQPELAGLVKGARRNRVGRLKGYGNAIVPQVAAEFIRAVMEARDGGTEHFDQAARIVESWPQWKRDIGHGLDPKESTEDAEHDREASPEKGN